MEWSTALPDWQERIARGGSLVPCQPIFPAEADAALAQFKALRLVDVAGGPTIGDVCRPWIIEFAAAVFGAYDPETGRRLIREFFLLVSKKNGKALALDTPVATPTGMVPIGEIAVGDLVMAADGKPTRVLAKSEIFTGRRCYEVEFSTGERVVCDAQHAWVTDAHVDRGRQSGDRKTPMPSVKTTEQIANSLRIKSGALTITNHRTALCGALDLLEAALPAPPYALGAWLGDGYSRSPRIAAGLQDVDEVLSNITADGQVARKVIYPSKPNAAVIVLREKGGRGGVPCQGAFGAALVGMGLIDNKHIPDVYLRASRSQRLALLQGLMDTDGSISKKGQAAYTTTSPLLRDGVVELVNSLGLKASTREYRATLDGRDCGPSWTIQFWPFDSMPVFRLSRKKARQVATRAANAPRSKTRQVTGAREVPSVATQCITVESETSQFLVTRSLLPTHNSTIAAGIMLTALIRNWRSSAEYVILAPTIEVADNSFRPAADMVRADEELSDLYHVTDNRRVITNRISGASLRVIAADNDTVSGKKATGVLVDELWAFGKKPNADAMLLEATGGLMSRPEGFIVYLSTQSDQPPAGVFKAKLHRFRNIRDGQVVDQRSLGVLYEFPEAMRDAGAHLDPANAWITNPNLGASVDQEWLEGKLAEAKGGDTAALATFAAKHLNIEIGLGLRTDRWAGAEHWERRAVPGLTLDEIIDRSEAVVIGADGGGLDDLFGLAVLGRDAESKDWLHWGHAWCHVGVLTLRQSIASRLKDFEAAGELTIVDDALNDIGEIVGVVDRVLQAGLLASVAVDPAGIGELVDALAEIGVTQDAGLLRGAQQGYGLMNAIKTCERKLVNGTLWHCGGSMMAWAVGNLKIEPTATAIRATKQNAGDAKIDPAMALFDAAWWMSTNPEPMAGSYLDDEELITL